MESFSLQNVIDGHGTGISITAMSIVFSGLLLISVCVALLPIVLNLMSKKSSPRGVVIPQPPRPSQPLPVNKEKKAETETAAVSSDDECNDIASVIVIVLQLEHERAVNTENEQITILRNNNRPSLWGSASKMREIPQRRTYA